MPYRLLLDTSSLMYRAFFALPPRLPIKVVNRSTRCMAIWI